MVDKLKLWLKKKILKWLNIPFDEVQPESNKLIGQDRTITISQYIMNNKLPDEPELKEAFIKHWFLIKNVSPAVVDTLSLQLISDLIEIDTLKTQLSEVKTSQKLDIERLKNGATNQGKAHIRHK